MRPWSMEGDVAAFRLASHLLVYPRLPPDHVVVTPIHRHQQPIDAEQMFVDLHVACASEVSWASRSESESILRCEYTGHAALNSLECVSTVKWPPCYLHVICTLSPRCLRCLHVVCTLSARCLQVSDLDKACHLQMVKRCAAQKLRRKLQHRDILQHVQIFESTQPVQAGYERRR